MDQEMSRLIQVAKLYYEENLNQSEIAKQIGVSRPLVSTMLTKARKLGIVEIKIKEPTSNNTLLLNQIKNIFNVQGGFVIPSASSLFLSEKAIVNQSVNFIAEILEDSNVLGLGWGYVLEKLVDAFPDSETSLSHSGKVVPLVGTAAFPSKAYHPSELSRDFAQKIGYEPTYFFAPAFPPTETELELYTNTDNYHDIYASWEEVDTVVLSIGTYPSVPDHATALRFGQRLNDEGAVGKILSYFYDKDGQIIKGDEDYAIQMPLNLLGKAKKVIAVCPVEINPKAVLGALKTGFITHIILTEDKAKEVINLRTL